MASHAKKRIALLVFGLLILGGLGCYFLWYLPQRFYSGKFPEMLSKDFPSLNSKKVKVSAYFPYQAVFEDFLWEAAPGSAFRGSKATVSLRPDKFYWPTELQIKTISVDDVPLAVSMNPEGKLLLNGVDLNFLASELERIGSTKGPIDALKSLHLNGVMTGAFGQWQLPESGSKYHLQLTREGDRLLLTIALGDTPRPLTVKISNLSVQADSLAVDLYGTLPENFTRRLLHLPQEAKLVECTIRGSLHMALSPFCLYDGKAALNFAEGMIELSPFEIKTTSASVIKIELNAEAEEKIGIANLEMLQPFATKIPSMSLAMPTDKTQSALFGGTVQYNLSDFRLLEGENTIRNTASNLPVAQNFSGTFNPQTLRWTVEGEPVAADSKLSFNLADHLFSAALTELSLGGTGNGMNGLAKITIKIADASCRGDIVQMDTPSATVELENMFSPTRNDRSCRFLLPELAGRYDGKPFSVKDCKQSIQTAGNNGDLLEKIKIAIELGYLESASASGTQIFENSFFSTDLVYDQTLQLYHGETIFRAGEFKLTTPEYFTDAKQFSFAGNGHFTAFEQPSAREIIGAMRKLTGTIQAEEITRSATGNFVFSAGKLSTDCDLQWNDGKVSGKLENAKGVSLRGKSEKGNFDLHNWQGTAGSGEKGWLADIASETATVTAEAFKGTFANAAMHLDLNLNSDHKGLLAQVDFKNYALEGQTGVTGKGTGGTAQAQLGWNSAPATETTTIDLNVVLRDSGFAWPAGYLNAKELLLGWTGIAEPEEHILQLKPLKTSLVMTDPAGEFASTKLTAKTVRRSVDFSSDPAQEKGHFSVDDLRVQVPNPESTIAFKQFDWTRTGDSVTITAAGNANLANNLFDFRNFSLNLPLSRSGAPCPKGQLKVDELFFGKFSLGQTAVDLEQSNHNLRFSGALKFLKDAKGALNYQGELSLPPYAPTIDLKFELPTMATTEPLSLSSFLADSTGALDFTGTFGIRGAVSGDIYNPQSTAVVVVDNGTLLHKDFLLSGIKTELNFENLFQMVSAPDQQLSFQSFVFEHAEVQNGSIQYALRNDRVIAINTAKFHALGGAFRAQSPILVDTNNGKVSSTEDATKISFAAEMISLADFFSFFKIGHAATNAKLNGLMTAQIKENTLTWTADLATPTGERGDASFSDLDRYALLQKSNENVEFALAFFSKIQYNFLKINMTGIPGKLHLTLTGDGRPAEPLPFKPAATPGNFTATSASDYYFDEELVIDMDIDVDADKFN